MLHWSMVNEITLSIVLELEKLPSKTVISIVERAWKPPGLRCCSARVDNDYVCFIATVYTAVASESLVDMSSCGPYEVSKHRIGNVEAGVLYRFLRFFG
jgi:hypothetical protein